LDDFSKAASFPFSYKSEIDNAQRQIESNPFYNISAKDFKVIQDNSYGSLSMNLASKKLSYVEEVRYSIGGHSYLNQTSTSYRKRFEVIIRNSSQNSNIEYLSGTATIVIKNGHELSVKF
jgi:hypothetical protein